MDDMDDAIQYNTHTDTHTTFVYGEEEEELKR